MEHDQTCHYDIYHDPLETLLSKTPSQVSTIRPEVTVDQESSPPTITVAVNGSSSIANLPTSAGVEIIHFTSYQELLNNKDNISASNFAFVNISDDENTISGILYKDPSSNLLRVVGTIYYNTLYYHIISITMSSTKLSATLMNSSHKTLQADFNTFRVCSGYLIKYQ